MRSAARITAAFTAIALTGCSFFGSRTQTITVSSDPIEADVIVNGEHVGKSPLRHQVGRDEDLLIEVRKPGYQTEYRSSRRTLSTLGILDVIGGSIILIPFIGLFSSAAWEHDPSGYGVTLTPEDEPKQ